MSALTLRLPDHPRIRGEHTSLLTEVVLAAGSSPHTRGARAEPPQNVVSRRIIPAYAGSTACGPTWRGRRPDHPRIRGEHEVQVSLLQCGAGSSPHTRGALVRVANANYDRRIIPAYAGSTQRHRGRFPLRPDHPRIRGEHAISSGAADHHDGSSPHTRGARRCARCARWRGRIIPAYAGSTSTRF